MEFDWTSLIFVLDFISLNWFWFGSRVIYLFIYLFRLRFLVFFVLEGFFSDIHLRFCSFYGSCLKLFLWIHFYFDRDRLKFILLLGFGLFPFHCWQIIYNKIQKKIIVLHLHLVCFVWTRFSLVIFHVSFCMKIRVFSIFLWKFADLVFEFDFNDWISQILFRFHSFWKLHCVSKSFLLLCEPFFLRVSIELCCFACYWHLLISFQVEFNWSFIIVFGNRLFLLI